MDYEEQENTIGEARGGGREGRLEETYLFHIVETERREKWEEHEREIRSEAEMGGKSDGRIMDVYSFHSKDEEMEEGYKKGWDSLLKLRQQQNGPDQQ